MIAHRPKRSRGLVFLFAFLGAALALGAVALARHSSKSASASAPNFQPAANRQQMMAAYAKTPLAFEANQGQTDARVKFLARSQGYGLFLTSDEVVFSLSAAPSARRSSEASQTAKQAVIRMAMLGSNPQAAIGGSQALASKTNYYVGNDPAKWRTGVPQYGRVVYSRVYPGVDMAFHGAQQMMEFDFVVAPGADPAPIALGFQGADSVRTDKNGSLVLASPAGNVTMHKPVAYQEIDGHRRPVEASFVVAENHVKFALGDYDRSRELVIDPTLSYLTFLGGTGEDEAFAAVVDSSGNLYVTGQTASIGFPTTSGTVTTNGSFDAFVTKINASASAISFTTVIGGSTADSGTGIAVNSTGVYVAGNTTSNNFPAGTTIGGGNQDAFVAKLNATTGAASFVTRFGGSGTDSANGIAVDSTGSAYVGGDTFSSNFTGSSSLPSSSAPSGGADTGFVVKFTTAGTAYSWATYLGGTNGGLVTGIALDSSNNVYATGLTLSGNFPTTSGAYKTTQPGGEDGFVSKLNSTGTALTYSTYLGGSGDDEALGIAVDGSGEAYVTGNTKSTNFPAVNAAQASNGGAQDAFVSKLSADGASLVFSTYLGGTLDDVGTGIALDGFADAYITGQTKSSNFPTSGSPFQASAGGSADAFITELSNSGYVVYSSYFGGNGDENLFPNTTTGLGAIAVDASSNAYLVGNTNTSNISLSATAGVLQTLNAGGLSDAFVAKVGAAPADFAVTASPSTTSVNKGSSGTYTVTVSSVNSAFGNSVALSCTGLSSTLGCSFSPASVTPGAGGATSTLTVTTKAATSGSLMHASSILYASWLPIGGIAILGAGFGARRKRLLIGFLLVLMLCGLMVMAACGGGSGGGGGGGGGGGTPSGNYTITISGASGNTHTTAVTLHVN
ncbi:MAG: SBBP repeat-containing protein [Acidobacteria bacterium]|nr:SBBP repeat-containing protein [Acidobacteriota bacterium]